MKHILLFVAGLFLLCSSVQAQAGEYNLTIARQNVNITGHPVSKLTINGTIPGPTLHFTEGEEVIAHVTNTLDVPTSIHWHGFLINPKMDGVPGFNGFGKGILPGQTFTYHFKVRQTGTYWYHSHSQFQEQDGLYGGIIVSPKGKDPIKTDRDYVVVLSDFTDEQGRDVMGHLKMFSDYYQYARRTLGDFIDDAKKRGFGKAWDDALAWGKMRMKPTDITDVTGYTFLVNGKTPDQNWTGIFKPGERVRLRFINASAMSMYDVRIPGLKLKIVSADGQPVEPVDVDEFRFGVAETYDVVVTPEEDKAYTIAAEPLDRTGFALATLAPREGMRGAVPKHRPKLLLTMADMGVSMKQEMGMMMPDMDDMHDMKGMSGMSTGDMTMKDMDHQKMGHKEMDMGHDGMKMDGMDMSGMDMQSGWAKAGTPPGNKALSYADLRYAGIQKDTLMSDRTILVELGGNMERYIWTINGKRFVDAKPINLNYGERVRLKFINNTMMAHPMHLHGMFVQLENGQPMEKLPNKHTVIVPPGGTYSVLLTADEPGEWAFHCHLLYHMAAGMMRKVVVAKLDPSAMPKDMKPHSMDMGGMKMDGMNMDMGGHSHAR